MMEENTTSIYDGTDIETLSTTLSDGAGIPPKPPSLTDLLMSYPNYRLAINLGLYVFAIIIGLGTLGNVLSFLVMVRKTMIITPTCFYMAVLAISDTVVLYTDCLKKWSFIKYGDDAWKLNTAGCRTVSFLTYSAFHFSVWIIVAMTTERFFAIRYPLKFLTIGTVGKTKVACLIILICVSILNCQFTWSVKVDNKGNCVPEENYYEFHKDVMPWIDAVFYSFLPFAILIIFNILIILSFSKAHRRQKTLRGDRNTNTQTTRNHASINHRMTAMLLSVTFTFIIMTAPKVILLCIRYEVFKFLKYNTFDLEEIALYSLISRIADLCIYMNHAINFLLYCVSGQRFRKELKLMLSCGNSRASLSVSSSKSLQTSRYQTMQTVSSNLGLFDYNRQEPNGVNYSNQENSV